MQTKHRAALALPLLLFALVLAGCSGGVAKPEGWASPVFDGGVTYAFQRKDSLTAIDANGNVKWTFPDENKESQKDIELGSVYGTPQLVEGVLYFASYEGSVAAVRAETGDLVWHKDIKESVVGSVAVDSGLVALGTTEGKLFVLSASDGSSPAAWPAKGLGLGGPIWAPTVARDGALYVATMRGIVRGYALETAKTLWGADYKTDGAIADLSLLENGELVVPSLDRRVYFLNAADGTENRAPAELQDWAWGNPAIEGTTIVLTDISGNVYGFDSTNGGQKWVYATGSRLKASPAIVNGTVIVADRSPEVHFIDIANGERLVSVPVSGVGTIRANPTLLDNVAYFITTSGHIIKADPGLRAVSEVFIGRYRQ